MSRKTINALVHKGKDICLKKREKKLTCIKIQKNPNVQACTCTWVWYK